MFPCIQSKVFPGPLDKNACCLLWPVLGQISQMRFSHLSWLLLIQDRVNRVSCNSRFNRKPNKGIAFLQSHQMIGASPTEIAEFLMTETRLHPAEVGDYLGENEKWVVAYCVFVIGIRLEGLLCCISKLSGSEGNGLWHTHTEPARPTPWKWGEWR